MKRIIAIFLCFTFAFSLFACSKAESEKKENDKETNKVQDAEDKDYTVAAVWSENTTVTLDMMTYYFNSYYRSFLEQYSEVLPQMGLDPTKDLSAQKYSDEYNWHQYMTLLVYNNMREMIALADAAKAEGAELGEEGKAELEEQMKGYKQAADESKLSLAEYISVAYGKGVTEDTLRRAIEIKLLASDYHTKLRESYDFSEEECEKYYEENSFRYLHYDCIKITVPKSDADILSKAEDEESFVQAMREIITKNNFLGDYDRFADTIEGQIKRKYLIRSNYVESSELCKWVNEEGRMPYDIHTKKESSGDITVTMLLPASGGNSVNGVLYRDDEPLRNLKYIFFEDDESGTEAIVKAETIYKNWQEDPTEERFDELMEKYDGGTNLDISRGEFTSDLTDWIFDESRKAGDAGCLDADEGAYLIYILEDGEAAWLREVRTALENKQYEEDINNLIDKYPTEYDENVVYGIKEVTVASSKG